MNGEISLEPTPSDNAGWSFDYTMVEGNEGEVEWQPVVRGLPLEETEYEMYQLDLTRENRRLGLRMGLRWNDRIYWWQFIRADFLQRGPVFDILRVGGPIYNEDTTLQADLYLILYANGVIEAYPHFITHTREGIGTEVRGIPVIAFDAPNTDSMDYVLDGSRGAFGLGPYALDLATSAGYASPEHPGSLRREGDVVVWQPWEDQQIFGGLLVTQEGVPEVNLIDDGRRGAPDFWVTKVGQQTIPRGVARSVPFRLSLGAAPPKVAKYQAPPWWHAECEALPTGDSSLVSRKGYPYLPVVWWAVPRALERAELYDAPDPICHPFELGRSPSNSDGSLGAAYVTLGNATGAWQFNERAIVPAYWWADIAVDHIDFTVHEIPKYSWHYLVQPYMRWSELIFAYYETGDPYLLQIAKLTADGYYRFFVTNRPHRFVGRDALGCADMLELYRCTGDTIYLDRVREMLAEARRSYGQLDEYMPGHQSGSGPNGVARRPSYDYIPMVLGRLHVQLLETGGMLLDTDEQEECWEFIRLVATICAENAGGGWDMRRTSLSYYVLTALADRYPEEEDRWLGLMMKWNAEMGLPEGHDGGKMWSWVNSAIRFDAWSWGATWEDGELYVRPRATVYDVRAPRQAVISTPKGDVKLRKTREGEIEVAEAVTFPVHIDPRK